MSFWSSLVTWANVPFVVALGVTVVFALLQMSGLLGLLAGDGDADGDDAGDLDGDGDADGDAGSDGDSDADDGDESAHSGGHASVLMASIGFGRVPTSILWQTFATSFAFAGLALNAIYLARTGTLPAFTLAWTLPLGGAFGFFATRTVARPLGRLLSNESDVATSRADLVGQPGVVISSRVNAEFGEVRIQDRSGHVLRVVVCSRDGEISEGAEVVVVDCDERSGRLYVAALSDTSP